nr:NADH dehydrogenase subunit 4L [Forskalia sp.]
MYSVSLLIFTLGIIGLIINKNNYIMIIICIELMLISIILNFLFFSSENLLPQLYIIYILAIAAIESAIGLSILVTYYKLRGSISLKYLNTLKG